MLLFSLRLVHYRGVDDRTVEFIAPGVTVVAGPNETGKSSLLEALDLLFRYPDDSKSARLREIQPVGRDVPTTVEAELSLGPERIRYRKTWFAERGTSLTIGSTSLTGRQAHDRAQAVFESYVDTELWQALVVSQARSLEQPQPQHVPSVLNALGLGAGSGGSTAAVLDPTTAWPTATQVADEEGMTLAGRVEREYARYYTPGRGAVSGELAERRRARDAAAADLEFAEEQVRAVWDNIERAEQLERERVTLTGDRPDAERVTARLAAEVAEAAEADRHHRLLAQMADGKAELACVARERACVRDRTIGQVSALDDQVATLGEVVDDLRSQQTAAEAAVADAEQVVAVTSVELAVAGDLVERQEALDRLRRDRTDLDALTHRLDAARQARAAERAAELELAESGPSSETAATAERLSADLDVALRSAEAQSARLTVRRLGGQRVRVTLGQDDIDLAAGTSVDLPVLETALVSIDGLLDLSVEPAEQLEARARADGLRADLDELLAATGCAGLEALRVAAARRAAAEQSLAEARRVADGVLAGSTVEELSARQTRLLTQIEHTLAQVGSLSSLAGAAGLAADTGVPVDGVPPVPTQVSLFDDDVADPRTGRLVDLDQVRSRHRQAEHALAAARVDLRDHTTELTLSAQRLGQAARQLEVTTAELAEQRAGLGDDEVLAAADRTRRDAAVAQAAAEGAGSEADLDSLSGRHTQAADRLRRVHQSLGQVEAEWNRALGRLDDAGARGVGTGRDARAAVFDQAEEQYQQVLRRAEAARLLRDTLAKHRAAARRDYAAPLRHRIAALGRRVFGPDFDVTLSEDLDVVSRTVDGTTLPVGQLSTGAREQLAIVVRLAIAALTSRDGQGVPVVLDDALGWSDSERLARMGDLLAEAGRHSQVVLLTSQPDRYAAIPGVNMVQVVADTLPVPAGR
jgi:recombinational DNA repair ATPase RecF